MFEVKPLSCKPSLLLLYPSLVEVDRSGSVFGSLFGRGDCVCIGYGPYPSSVEVDYGCIASVAL